MPENSSTSFTDSLPLSSPNSSLAFYSHCLMEQPIFSAFAAYTITNIVLLLPLCILVLCHGLKRWQQPHSSSASSTTAHSDSFTYHLVTMEIVFFFGFTWFGETFFQPLTCMEHYLAVVHPITYLSLRKEKWIRIRNIITGGAPGRQDRDRMTVNQSKLKAFYTIVAILGVLLLRCPWNVLLTMLYVVNVMNAGCVVSLCELWMRIPSTLVLPLLFLQRSGVLAEISVNSSSSSTDSFPLSSTNSTLMFQLHCFMDQPNSSAFTAYTITSLLLLLPLCILVFYHGLRRRQQPRSSSTASTTAHSDSFTYHLVTMEIVYFSGCIICCCGIYNYHFQITQTGTYFLCFTWFGETFFQPLTCMEHYLAVVHPITYLSLRKERGVRIRNIITGCVWLLCIAATTVVTIKNTSEIVRICILFPSLMIITFCSLSVLCVLIRPGPGRQNRDRMRVNQSKLKAFYTIVAILGVLLLRCAWNVPLAVLYMMNVENVGCVVAIYELWMRIPSTLVSPLLFLQRSGAFAACKNIKGK
ncbi:hypothetical protein Q8A73_012822 [Channa argus]|nr:hypothetical protein Q8A73_012822 [Channa argus]